MGSLMFRIAETDKAIVTARLITSVMILRLY